MTNCLVCNGQDAQKFISLEKFDYVQCAQCRLVWMEPLPEMSEIKAYYDQASHSGSYSTKIDLYHELRKNVFRSYLLELERSTAAAIRGKKMLDVGCFNGASLEVIQEFGAEAFGFELQERAAAEATRRAPGQVIQGDFAQTEVSIGQFDFISMTDFIEHVLEPQRTLEKAREFLRPQGYLLLTTPNTSSWMAKILRRSWPSYMPVHHIYLFNPKNLYKLLQQLGLRVVRTKPLFKKYSLEYVRWNLHNFKPGLAKWTDLLPSALSRMEIPLSGGEMLMIAQKE